VNETHEYKIEHIVDQGFAGGPANMYRISQYAYIPIFLKQLDYVSNNAPPFWIKTEKKDHCIVEFERAAKTFNICTGVLTDRVPAAK
jgi:hypothetical protein